MGTKLRDRTRSVKYRLLEIGRASRGRNAQSQRKMEQAYRKLLSATGRVAHARYLERMIPLVKQVMRQTRERVLQGNTRAQGKLVSLFEPQTEVIRKGKAAKPTEFGKLIKVQEAEGQIITHYEVDRKSVV